MTEDEVVDGVLYPKGTTILLNVCELVFTDKITQMLIF
jgi:hypothetical protein